MNVASPTQPHWIRRNEASRQPSLWLFIAAETVVTPTASGEVHTFRCATALNLNGHKGAGHPIIETWKDCATPEALWTFAEQKAYTSARLIVVAHDLGRHLQVLQALTILPAMGWTLEVIRLDKGSTFARWAKDKRRLVMIDAMSWFPATMGKLAALTGLQRIDVAPGETLPEVWQYRCRQDVAIIRETYRRIGKFCEVEDLGNWKPSGAGQAWSAWRHQFMPHKVLAHQHLPSLEMERDAMYSGRCEAWRHGTLPRQKWYEWDFANAYASIIAETDLPSKMIGFGSRHLSIDADPRRRVERRLWRCTVTQALPIVPCRVDGRIIWPVGTFDTVLWDREVEMVREFGGTVTGEFCLRYRSYPILAEFGTWLLDKLDAPADEVDPVVQLALKHWGRSIVGKFGQRVSKWSDWGDALDSGLSLSTAVDVAAGDSFRVLQIGERLQSEGPREFSRDACPAVLSAVMAELRCKLWRTMNVAGLAHVAYCDTDGLIVDRSGHLALSAAGIPGLRLKSELGRVKILGPRQLVSDGSMRVAGVPKTAVEGVDGRLYGEITKSLAVGLREGENGAVRVVNRSWRLHGVDTRRTHLAQGRTAAVVIGA